LAYHGQRQRHPGAMQRRPRHAAEKVDCQVPSMGGGVVLSVQEAFCHLASGEGGGGGIDESLGPVEWLPCSLILTGDALHLSQAAGGGDQEICSLRLETVCDVAASTRSGVADVGLAWVAAGGGASSQAELSLLLRQLGLQERRARGGCGAEVAHRDPTMRWDTYVPLEAVKDGAPQVASPVASVVAVAAAVAEVAGEAASADCSGGTTEAGTTGVVLHAPNLSERSTGEGSICGTAQAAPDLALEARSPSPPAMVPLPPESPAAEEWLLNGVAVGNFDLPPIPLARLPESRSGLPPVAGATDEDGSSKAHQKWMKDVFRKLPYPRTHWGVPMREYDGSNCHPHVSMDGRIPPLPPSSCRLPQRTHRELRTRSDRAPTVEFCATPCPYLVVLWAASEGSSGGRPVLLSFPRKGDAALAYDALLRCCAAQLRGDGAPAQAKADA